MTILICFVRSLRCLFVACLLLPGAMLYANTPPTAGAGATRNPDLEQRILSPGNTAYYVDPIGGDDNRSGLRADQAWRTFDQINSRSFAPGDRIEILRPGIFGETLMPQGTGSADSPVEIHFAAGRYDFYPSNALKLKLYISNDNDAPGSSNHLKRPTTVCTSHKSSANCLSCPLPVRFHEQPEKGYWESQ